MLLSRSVIVIFMTVIAIGTSTESTSHCLSELFSLIPGHAACLPKSPRATSIAMPEALKRDIVWLHNVLRCGSSASNMQKMVWDDELAAIAKKWTDSCTLSRNEKIDIPGKYSVGQNLAAVQSNWTVVINNWYDEIEFFRYNRKDLMQFVNVGHFTQLVWAESAKIGCAWTECSNAPGNKILYACNYAKQGNSHWWIPYSDTGPYGRGGTCAFCPDTCDNIGLCDCNGKVCENGGHLDVNSCLCTCTKNYHIYDSCQLDCAFAEDNSACDEHLTKENCSQYLNVPLECPFMCDVCPLADFRRSLVF